MTDEIWQPGTPVTEAEALLDQLYAMLPAIDCKGKCWDTCTDIDASELERRRMAARGAHLPEAEATVRARAHKAIGVTPRCPALSSFNTCTVYDVRPFVCRAFGTVLERGTPQELIYRSAMMCDYGCVPDGVIDVADFVRALDKIELLSRQMTGVTRRKTMQETMDSLLPPARGEAKRKGGKGKCRKRRRS